MNALWGVNGGRSPLPRPIKKGKFAIKFYWYFEERRLQCTDLDLIEEKTKLFVLPYQILICLDFLMPPPPSSCYFAIRLGPVFCWFLAWQPDLWYCHVIFTRCKAIFSAVSCKRRISMSFFSLCTFFCGDNHPSIDGGTWMFQRRCTARGWARRLPG